MKREYVKPVYIAESYMFTESIAACDISVGSPETNPITVNKGDSMCPVGDSGHIAGKGYLGTEGYQQYPVTIFNDGPQDGCSFDWNGDRKEFGQAFYGANPSEKKHIPAHNGSVFFS